MIKIKPIKHHFVWDFGVSYHQTKPQESQSCVPEGKTIAIQVPTHTNFVTPRTKGAGP